MQEGPLPISQSDPWFHLLQVSYGPLRAWFSHSRLSPPTYGMGNELVHAMVV